MDVSLLFLITAALVLLLALLLLRQERKQDPARILRTYSGSSAQDDTDETPLQVGSWQHKARLAFGHFKLDVSGSEGWALALTYLLLASLIGAGLKAVLRLPNLAMAVGALSGAGFALAAWLNRAWDHMQRQMEKELPTLMIRLSGMIQAAPNVLESLDEVTQSLDPHKPLQAWMNRLIRSVQAEGVGAFQAMEEEATLISPALVLAVVQIRRLWQSGGSGYVEAFRMVADHLSELMSTRAMAYAKAGRGGNLAAIIVVAALFSLTMILRGTSSRSLFLSNPVTRLGLVAYFLWGGFGWFYIRSILKSVTQ